MTMENRYPLLLTEQQLADLIESEEGIKRIAVERLDTPVVTLFAKRFLSAIARPLCRRVGAWSLGGLQHGQSPSESEVVCEYCGGDGYHAVMRTPGVDCEPCKGHRQKQIGIGKKGRTPGRGKRLRHTGSSGWMTSYACTASCSDGIVLTS